MRITCSNRDIEDAARQAMAAYAEHTAMWDKQLSETPEAMTNSWERWDDAIELFKSACRDDPD